LRLPVSLLDEIKIMTNKIDVPYWERGVENDPQRNFKYKI